MPKARGQWFIGGAFILSFFALLALRMDLFSQAPPHAIAPSLTALADQESWRIITQGGARIGYTHRRFTRGTSSYHLEEEVFMRLNQLGLVQDVETSLHATFDNQGSPSSFTYRLVSGVFQYRLQGMIEEGQLILLVGGPGDLRKTILPLEGKPYLASGLVEALGLLPWQEGESREFQLLDPSVPAIRPARVVYLGREKINLAGQTYQGKKYSLSLAGAEQFAWLSDEGEVLKETGLLGITIEKATREEARRDFPVSPGLDLAEMAAIRADKTIDDPPSLSRLTLRLLNLPTGGLSLEGGRQTFRDGLLTITKEALPPGPAKTTPPPGTEKSLAVTALIQSDHPRIREALAKIISPGDRPPVKAKKILNWVYKNIEKRPVISVPNALDTLVNRAGDCNEHAVLLAALARAAGLPAGIEAGLVYQGGRFYYHAWNVFYLDGWVTADATFGQMPADATHIRLVRDEGAGLVALLGVIGKLGIEIVEMTR
ncbi:MAG: transglutaminase-like domain-containing protein, partial [Smithellaceae bacterium]|nr:transglutaminase-like domain-containing protein [Smithellaceae bacterium]